MIPTDERSRWSWTGGVLTDPRVVHFWDEKKTVGRWYAKLEQPQDETPGIVWDAFYLYGPGAFWEVEPEPLIVRGATVQQEKDKLKIRLLPLLRQGEPQSGNMYQNRER